MIFRWNVRSQIKTPLWPRSIPFHADFFEPFRKTLFEFRRDDTGERVESFGPCLLLCFFDQFVKYLPAFFRCAVCVIEPKIDGAFEFHREAVVPVRDFHDEEGVIEVRENVIEATHQMNGFKSGVV